MALRDAFDAVLSAAFEHASCCNLHHAKEDGHDYGSHCPAEIRLCEQIELVAQYAKGINYKSSGP